MNVDRFTQTLPAQYENWGTPDVRPLSEVYIDKVWAMSAPVTHTLLNHATRFLESGEVYLEVGVLQGAAFTAALMHNKVLGIAVDNFSMLPSTEGNKKAFLRRIEELEMVERTTLYEQDFVEFFLNPPDVKVGVYFCDGPHGYKGTWDGLELSIPVLADSALIVMDDYNWDDVRKATLDWMESRKNNVTMLFDLQTPLDSKLWWNGLAVISWKRNA